MNIEIKTGTIRHLDAVLGLLDAVQALHVAHVPGFFSPLDPHEVRRWFAAHLALPPVFLLVATRAAEVVGYLLFSIEDAPAHVFGPAHHFATIDQISVDPGHRRSGVGHALMEELRVRMRAAGIGELRSEHLGFNEASRAFFDREGFGVHVVGRFSRLDDPDVVKS